MGNYFCDITGYRQSDKGCDLRIHIHEDIRYIIENQKIRKAEVVLNDGRTISTDQRKKIYATIRDISNYTGDIPEATKEWMKYGFIEKTGNRYFSLSDCSVTTAKDFINYLMDFCLYNGIILTESGLKRTDDINTYLIQCICHKKCCICGKMADIHHIDAIGMGNDRSHYDDSGNEIIALCRHHHNQAHEIGRYRFMEMYKVYGIKKFDVISPEDNGDFNNFAPIGD